MFNDLVKNLVDRYRERKIDQLDWITRNRLLMKKALVRVNESYEQEKAKPSRLKMAFWSMTPWERGGVDHMLALSLKARGHEVVGMYCDGGMTACSMESTMFPRPSCDDCVNRHHKLLEVWGFQHSYQKTSSKMKDDVKATLASLVEQTALEELENLEYLGVKIGELAKMDLPQFFMRLVDIHDPEVGDYYRRSICGIGEYVYAANEFLEAEKPDRAILTSGRTTSHSGFYQLCLLKNIPVVTWDESVGGLGAFVFTLNEYAVDYKKHKVWERIKNEALTSEEEDFVQYYFAQTSQGKFGRHQYYNNPITNRAEVLKLLGLDENKKTIVMLTNLTWDTSALGKGIFFKGMLEWLYESIDVLSEHPDYQLVIRTHPAEGHLADYAKGRESVSKLLKARYPDLPDHIKIISGHEEVNSHTLCDISSCIVTYSTSVGIEMAVRGRKVMTVGKAHYRGKGFTVDPETKREFFELLMSDDFHRDTSVDESWVNLAKKYAYFFIVRTESYLDEFNIQNRHEYKIVDPEAFLPNQTRRWDSLCAEVEDLGYFVDCTDYIDPWDSPEKT